MQFTSGRGTAVNFLPFLPSTKYIVGFESDFATGNFIFHPKKHSMAQETSTVEFLKALSGLYFMLAEEEKKIRQNYAAMLENIGQNNLIGM